jgi:diacylglycerol kinase family enzyme
VLDLLVEPTRIELGRAVVLATATPGKGPFVAFNILSVGLDAFVTHMTNRMKGNLPGDSYKLWVDVATLFYDRVYRIAQMGVTPYDDAGRPLNRLLGPAAAPGLRGLREPHLRLQQTHPAHERNVCAVSQMPLLKKLALKPYLISGRHAGLKEVRLFSAARVRIDYSESILAQMDGEAIPLEPCDFPITISLSEPAIPALKRH